MYGEVAFRLETLWLMVLKVAKLLQRSAGESNVHVRVEIFLEISSGLEHRVLEILEFFKAG
jgi:hypothetical protein